LQIGDKAGAVPQRTSWPAICPAKPRISQRILLFRCESSPNQVLHRTDAAILVSRDAQFLQVVPAGELVCHTPSDPAQLRPLSRWIRSSSSSFWASPGFASLASYSALP